MATKLILLAVVVAVDAGGIRIDKGILDGLRHDDIGAVHYELQVGAKSRRVDTGRARVVALEDHGATLEIPAGGARQQLGFEVEFELLSSRLAPGEVLIGMARHRLGQKRVDEAAEYLDSWEKLLAIDGAAPEIAVGAAAVDEDAAALLRDVAAALLERGDLERAERYLRRAQELRPGEPGAPRLMERLRLELSDVMAEIAAARYEVGADLEDAGYYNQHPRFTVELAGFRLDDRPITRRELAVFRPDGGFAERGDEFATGLSFAEVEAYCRWRDKRLPSEFEWEVAVERGAVDATAPIYEWTASWYQAYPGNTVGEKEFGETARVLRGHLEQGKLDPTVRRFLAPQSHNARVGFRCAR